MTKSVQIGLVAACLLVTGRASAQPPTFQHHVLPILKAKCLSCHGGAKLKGRLDLRTLESTLKGGKSGPAVLGGKPDESVLWQRIDTDEMPPPDQPRLGAAEKATIRRWIEAGRFDAVAAAKRAPGVSAEDRRFWSFRPPVKPVVPTVKNSERIRTPVDAFVQQRLEAKGLTMRPEASREKLIRRLYFDVIGLPPTPDEVARFVASAKPQASYAELVHKLLASPQYGERWARHWLDVAGYADSNGRRGDEERIGAWRYRDWVIRALNADMPYDRFVTEQLAGDELTDWRHADRLTPAMLDRIVATGFFRCAPDATDNEMVDMRDDRFETLHDTVEITARALLGLTVGCAKCHDHKYDPIPQEDFYRLEACFQPAYDPDNWLPANKRSFRDDNLRYLPDLSPKELAGRAVKNKEIDAAIAKRQAAFRIAAATVRKTWIDAEVVKLPADVQEPVRKMLATPKDRRDAAAKKLAEQYEKALTLADAELLKRSPECRYIRDDIDALKAKKPPAPERLWALWDMSPEPPATRLLIRGDFKTPGNPIAPGVLTVLDNPKQPFAFPGPDRQLGTSGRRRALADWITRPDHPLTARVIVNRVWQHHFGKGIVRTPDDFGSEGVRPTHPELLDWLAVKFVEDGWSLRKLHRTILLSHAYRQAADFDGAAHKLDPANELLWRRTPLRLEAETLRDTLLAVSGTLNPRAFGPPVRVKKAADGQYVPAVAGPDANRRSIYLLNIRSESLTFLNVFDAPVMELNCPERFNSTVPLQALALLNNPLVVSAAKDFAARVRTEAGESVGEQVRVAFRIALGRLPDAQEQAQGERFLAGGSEALANFCQVLLGTNEFLYVD